MIKPISSFSVRHWAMAVSAAAMLTTGCATTRSFRRPEVAPRTPIGVGNIVYYQADLSPEVPVKVKKHLFKPDEYTVTLSDGTVLEYTDNQPKHAFVVNGIDMGYMGAYNNNCIQFNNCNLKSIKGTPNRDYYYLRKTNVDTLDLAGNKGVEDELRLNDSKCGNIIGKGGFVVSYARDPIIMNEGWVEKEEFLH